jgi:hypothetical protein
MGHERSFELDARAPNFSLMNRHSKRLCARQSGQFWGEATQIKEDWRIGQAQESPASLLSFDPTPGGKRLPFSNLGLK